MTKPNPPQVKERYFSDEFDVLGFHDCHIFGIRWSADAFEVVFDLDYIVKWVPPVGGETYFRFWIAPAELRFANVEDLDIELSWGELRMDCVIQDLHRGDSRTTPSGVVQWHWDLELSAPEGRIEFWATGFQLRILEPPMLSATQQLDRRERNR